MSSDRDEKPADPAAPSSAPAKPADPATPESSGSIDVAITGSLPAASSGSIDVAMSGPIPASASSSASSASPPPGEPIAPAAKPSDGTPVPVAALDSEPVSSGRVLKAITAGNETPRPRRLSAAAKDAIGGGVTRLGTGIGTLGEGISRLGEKSHKVPLVGAGVSALGESISNVGESITGLPRAARTRRGRLLVRSTIVGFLLVAVWIAVIVALQVRGIDAPDFRPVAEKILIELSKGRAEIEQVYEDASPRFHEMVRKDRFVDNMTDMDATIGKFVEITAVNESLVTTGPTGRVGRVSITVAYSKGKTRASVSLHWNQGRWRLLGIGVDVPPELKITKAQREERVQACKDPMDPKKCDLFIAANQILEQLRDGKADQVWDNATKVFQKQEERSRFVMLMAEPSRTLGDYRRIIAVTEAKLYGGGTTATYDVLTEYTKSNGVRAIFGFYHPAKGTPWKLRSLKIVLPMPRADEPLGTAPETKPTDEPPAGGGPASAGAGDGATGSASGSASGSGSGAASASTRAGTSTRTGSSAP